MDRLSPLDALFLHAEDGISHMHIGSCSIFAGPTPPFDEVSALIESKLPVLAHYRQRLRFVPAGLGHPVWVDDPHFNLGYHVRHSALPAPGGEEELENLIGRVMSQELDRHRPLWEAWVVEGLSDDRWAMISKVHHCLADGVSGTDLMAVLLDPDPHAVTAAAPRWVPEPEPSGAELAAEAITDLAFTPVRQLRALGSSALSPRQALRRVGDVVAGLRSFSRFLKPAEPLSIEGSIGPHRRYAASRCGLDDVRAIRRAFGGSVNDVVLAVITGAFRDVLLERGDPVEGVSLRSLVPVSTRADDDHTTNNQVSLIIAELPIAEADPVARLATVRAQMAELKASHQVTAGEAVFTSSVFAPPLLLALGIRAAMAMLRRSPQHNINTVTTNVPGPQYPLFALGRGMLEYLPYVPLSPGVRIGVAVMSYNGHLSFGITGDYDTAPDVHFMAERIEAAMNTLRAHADLATAASAGIDSGEVA